uniref:Uncharacterized protein n=1 Tax=Molossus molossus TaxID=27622 RepID=A0A7J8JWR1_MOLMO|nr:hypothetical protein HJG59_007974 [Molossus molossus]
MDSTQLRKLLPLFPCPTSPLWGLLKGRWAWMVGGFFFCFCFVFFVFLFFTQGSGRTSNCSACYLPSIFSLTFTVPSCLLLSCQVNHPPHPSFLAPCSFRLPGDLFCFLLCFFFCFECLSLQVSVAGRSPFRSQRLQCKFPFPLGKCTTLFWGVWGLFLFFSFFFSLCLFFPPFIWKEWEEVGTGRWEVDFVYFFSSFPGGWEFFLNMCHE